MRYIVARFNILEEKLYRLEIGSYSLLIHENDVIEGIELLRECRFYNKDSKAIWVKLQNENKFSNQNDLYDRIKQGITEDKTYYLIIDSYFDYPQVYPLVVWVGESLNNKAIENLIFNIQAINLGFIKDLNVYRNIIKNPVVCIKLEHLIPHIFIQ